jgi:hypothetical protein
VASSPITAAQIWPRDQATQRKKEELAPSPVSAAGCRGARAGTADRGQRSQLPDDHCGGGASGCGDSAAGRGMRACDESWPGGRFRRASIPQTSVPMYLCTCVRACMRPTTPMHSGRPSLVDPQCSLDKTVNALYPTTRHTRHTRHKHKTHNTHKAHTQGETEVLLILHSEITNTTKTNT